MSDISITARLRMDGLYEDPVLSCLLNLSSLLYCPLIYCAPDVYID